MASNITYNPLSNQREVRKLFDEKFYRSQSRQLESFSGSLLDHYLCQGWSLGLCPNPLFDPQWYIHFTPEIAPTGEEPLTHFVTKGWKKAASTHPLFDTRWYLEVNPDVAERGMNPLVHYLYNGYAEGRSPHPWFDVAHYLKELGRPLPEGENPVTHYMREGWKAGISPKPDFETEAFLQQHSRLSNSGIPPLILQVSLVSGIDLKILEDFSSSYYQHLNPDLDLTVPALLAKHYSMQGHREGRRGKIPNAKSVTVNLERANKTFKEEKPILGGEPKFSSPLIIAGFHRSGTSMTSNLFHFAGLHLGDDLLGAMASNKYGHFEDKDVIAFHEGLLAKAGAHWQTDSSFIPLLDDSDYRKMLDYGVEKSIYPCWGLKDPRVSLFLSEWADMFKGAHVLYVYRPCIECVASLKKRAAAQLVKGQVSQINERFWTVPDLAIKMYLVYAQASLDFLETRREKVAVVPLEDIVAGRDIVKEVVENWGYPLSESLIGDFYDLDAMSVDNFSEVIFDPSLDLAVRDVEHRFEKLAANGFV